MERACAIMCLHASSEIIAYAHSTYLQFHALDLGSGILGGLCESTYCYFDHKEYLQVLVMHFPLSSSKSVPILRVKFINLTHLALLYYNLWNNLFSSIIFPL
uniref:Uncharacterized protein n=1 Tax=Cacopsylla melanoneura TaxID=428564 RepID=A0A8D9BMP8_9HEMI